MVGKVAVFWPHKHFGFITEGNTTREIFFHQDNLTLGSSLPEKGSTVSYEVSEFNGRRCAANVRVVPSSDGGAA